MKKILLLAIVALLMTSVSAFASVSDGSYNMTVDDAFEFYISQNDFTQGTLIGSGNNWQTAYSGGFNLVSGQTNYLHVVGRDQHQVIAGFLGDFTLGAGNSYIFQNGTKNLLTNAGITNDWTVRTTGWDTSWATLTSRGPNSSANPWFAYNGGPVSGIAGNAEWIWTNNGLYTDSPRYFSTKIVTPEPIGMVLFGLGAGVLGLTKLRRKKK